jgi:hypothetical protein
MPRNLQMGDDMVTVLRECGVPESAMNAMMDAGLVAPYTLVATNDTMLRSFGLRTSTREKIRAWVCSQRCVFTVSFFSNEFAVGDPEGISSMVDYEAWEPYLNQAFSPANRGFLEVGTK